MNRILLALAVTLLVTGCGSSVKLDDVVVEDKTGTPVSRQPAGSQTPVAGGASGQGPAVCL